VVGGIQWHERVVALDMLRELRVRERLQGCSHSFLKIFAQVIRQEEIMYGALVRQHISVIGPEGCILVVLDLL